MWGCTQLSVCKVERSRSVAWYSWSLIVKLPAPTPASGWSAIMRQVACQISVRPPSLGESAWCGRLTSSRSSQRPRAESEPVTTTPATRATAAALAPHWTARLVHAGTPSCRQPPSSRAAPLAAAAPNASHAARDCKTTTSIVAAMAARPPATRHLAESTTAPHRHSGTSITRKPANRLTFDIRPVTASQARRSGKPNPSFAITSPQPIAAHTAVAATAACKTRSRQRASQGSARHNAQSTRKAASVRNTSVRPADTLTAERSDRRQATR